MEKHDKIRKIGIDPQEYLETMRTGVTLSDDTVKEILTTLRHARTFITSREKMHPDGVKLYDELIKNLEGAI